MYEDGGGVVFRSLANIPFGGNYLAIKNVDTGMSFDSNNLFLFFRFKYLCPNKVLKLLGYMTKYGLLILLIKLSIIFPDQPCYYENFSSSSVATLKVIHLPHVNGYTNKQSPKNLLLAVNFN